MQNVETRVFLFWCGLMENYYEFPEDFAAMSFVLSAQIDEE